MKKQTIKNKKAQLSFDILIYIPRFIFLIVVLFSIIFLIGHFVAQNLNVQDTQAEVFSNRVLYSPNGINYFDSDLNREIPGIINLSKLTNDTLDNMMQYKDTNFIAAQVDLLDFSSRKIASAQYNEITFKRWLPIARTGLTGLGGVRSIQKTIYVNYFNDSMLHPGFINFTILMPGNTNT